MLTGENGIIRQAQKAKEETEKGEEKEQVSLAVTAAMGKDEWGNINKADLQEELDNLTGGKATVNGDGPFTVEFESGRNYIVDINGKVTEGSGGSGGSGGGGTSIAGKKYDDETDITVDGTPVTVPGGATISGIEEETTIDDGLVIYIIPEGEEVTDWEADSDNNGIIDVQEKYDQFVWVPVPNAIAKDKNSDGTIDETDIDLMIADEEYPMAIATDATNYRGVLYDFTLTDGKVTVSDKSWSSTSTSYREPAYLTDSSDGDASSYHNNVGITESSLQEEFNTMVNRVSSKKGFWVGRYETSNMVSDNTQDSTNKVTVVRGTSTGITSVNWYRMYAQQKNYAKLAFGNTTIATSSMIWGSQWDQIMIWMKNVKNTINTTNGEYYILNAVGMGNYSIDETGTEKTTKALESTGNSENYKVKNVYDLAGNVYDSTLEASRTKVRVLRGGCYDNTSSSYTRADLRVSYSPNGSNPYRGSRSTLY